ncbi:carboxypeptidase regulatory-like domain-containing protein [Myxococcota bacterium]|nr:carboxypeptidase regulatory-like domain-containing protein [Myxococcota bacterium]
MALIEGTVVFRGAPVPEALVRATSFRGDEPWAHVPRTVRTDVDGRFTLVLPHARRGWMIDVVAGRRLRGARLIEERRVRSATIELVEAGLVVVRVLAPGGAPVAGARVSAEPQLWFHEAYHSAVGHPALERPAQVGLVTDARGEVTLRIIEPRLHDIRVEHSTLGRACSTYGLDVFDREAPIVLELDGVAPVAPTDAVAERVRRPPRRPELPPQTAEPEAPSPARSNVLASGSHELVRTYPPNEAILTVEFEGAPRPPSFTVAAMVPRTFLRSRRRVLVENRGMRLTGASGRWPVQIHAPGFVSLLRFVEPRDEVQRLTWTLGRGAVLRGRVFDRRTGAPIAGAQMSFLRDLASGGFRRLGRSVSGADGRYTFAGLEPCNVVIAASAPGFAVELVGRQIDEGMVTCDVELDAEVVVTGRVEWCGEPVKRTQLALEPIVVDDDRGDDGARRRDLARACTQRSATPGDLFRVGRLRPGTYHATLWVGRFEGDEFVDFDVDVPPQGIEGLVLDVDALREASERAWALRAETSLPGSSP